MRWLFALVSTVLITGLLSVSLAADAEGKDKGPQSIRLIAQLPGQDMLIAVPADGDVYLTSGKVTHALRGARGPIAWTRDGKTLVTGATDKGALLLWDLPSRQLQRTLRPNLGQIASFDLSPDGKTVAIGTSDGSVALWGLAQEKVSLSLAKQDEPIAAMRYSPDGTMLATAVGQTAFVWDAANGTLLATLKGHQTPIKTIRWGVKETLDTRAAGERRSWIWRARTGQLLSRP